MKLTDTKLTVRDLEAAINRTQRDLRSCLDDQEREGIIDALGKLIEKMDRLHDKDFEA